MDRGEGLMAIPKEKVEKLKAAYLKRKDETAFSWLTDHIGTQVEIYCMRAPRVVGKVKHVDLRYMNVLIENDEEIVQVAVGQIAQVRFPKSPQAEKEKTPT